jgi:hypothetical protein
MNKLSLLGTVSMALVLVACGGETKPAKAPEPVVGAADAKTDLPPGHDKDGESTADKDHGKGNDDKAEKKAEKGPAGGMITVAAMKFTPAKKGKADKALEVKQDGTVTADGKTTAKIAGDEVKDATGTTLVTIGVDGSLVGTGVKPGLKFQGDELTAESGAKVTVGEDGTVTLAKADGKSEPLGKFEGGASAKRAALLVTALWLMPADATKADAKKDAAKVEPKKDAAKTDAKPTEKASTPAKK